VKLCRSSFSSWSSGPRRPSTVSRMISRTWLSQNGPKPRSSRRRPRAGSASVSCEQLVAVEMDDALEGPRLELPDTGRGPRAAGQRRAHEVVPGVGAFVLAGGEQLAEAVAGALGHVQQRQQLFAGRCPARDRSRGRGGPRGPDSAPARPIAPMPPRVAHRWLASEPSVRRAAPACRGRRGRPGPWPRTGPPGTGLGRGPGVRQRQNKF
jgi:hypothetical protein